MKPFSHSNTSFPAFFTGFRGNFFSVISPQTTDSLFQGKPLSRESFPGNHFSRELFHKTSFQKAIVPTGIFSKKALFQWDCISARTPFRGTVLQEPCLQRNCFSKIPVSGNCSKQSIRCVGISIPYLQTSLQEIVSKACFLFSQYPCQDTTSFQDIVPKTLYLQTSHTKATHLTVPRAPFSRSVIPFRHSVTPSLRFCLHSDNQKIVFIPTIHSNNPCQQSMSTIHVNNPCQ